MTPKSLFGVSAVSPTWKRWFTQAFFTASATEGRRFLLDIQKAFNEEWLLPKWALVFVLSLATELNISPFLDLAVSAEISEQFKAWKETAEDMLFKHTKENSSRSVHVIESEHRSKVEIFVAHLDTFIQVSREFTGIFGLNIPIPPKGESLIVREDQPPSQNALLHSDSNIVVGPIAVATIFDALYNLEESAAELITTNEETVSAFFEAQRNAQCQLAASGVAFLYALWSAYDAATKEPAVETKAVATVSSRVIAAVKRVENIVPAKYRVAGSVMWATGLAYEGVCWVQQEVEMRYEGQVPTSDIIVEASTLAYDTRKILELMSVAANLDDDQKRVYERQGADVLARASQVPGKRLTIHDLSESLLFTYMDLRRGQLEALRRRISEQWKCVNEVK